MSGYAKNPVGAHYGLSAWLLQRLTAVVMAAYTVFRLRSQDLALVPEILKGQMVETQDMRCPKCGRFLGWQAVIWGVVKIKCTNSKCKQLVILDIRPDA